MSRAGPDIITSETRTSFLQTSVFGGKKKKTFISSQHRPFRMARVRSPSPEVIIKTELFFLGCEKVLPGNDVVSSSPFSCLFVCF